MDTTILVTLLSVPLLILLTFYILAQIVSHRAYKRVVIGVALGPAGLWAALGLSSNRAGLILGMAALLVVTVMILAGLVSRIVYGRDT